MSEAITNQRAGDVLDAVSGGSAPVGEVHPLTLDYLQRTGYSVEGLRSQSWEAFNDWPPDVVITVCDRAAGEACPLYLGDAIKVHWGLMDPSTATVDDGSAHRAFMGVISQIEHRVDELREIARLPRDRWARALKALVA